MSSVLTTMPWVSLLKNVAWNGMLAVVPVAAAYALRSVLDKRPTSFVRYLGATVLSILWFVFLPNTCYLLTEWRHFLVAVDARNLYLQAETDRTTFVLLLLGTVFYFTYALFGMMMFAMAIRPVERLATRRGISVKLWGLPFFAAVSLGVYLGLVLRFNSWELATKPAVVWAAVVEAGGRPLLTCIILGFAVFLWIAYETLDIWLDGLKQRLVRGKSEA